MDKSGVIGVDGQEAQTDVVVHVKELLADPGSRILLHDLVVQELKRVIELTADDSFNIIDQSFSEAKFAERLAKYEEITRNLRYIAACIAYWGEDIHRNVLTLIHSRITDFYRSRNGLVVWLPLRWYPLILLLYSSGISALAARKHANLAAIFSTNTHDPDSSQGRVPLVYAVGKALLEMNQADGFKALSEYKQKYVPRSEYLFNLLNPELNELFFLGQDYEDYFDQFEIFLALANGYYYKQNDGHFWAPLGRFTYKARSDERNHPFQWILTEAETQRNNWQPIRANLFPADIERFEEIASELKEKIRRQQWY